MTRGKHARAIARGFTLLELMVALTLGGIAITSIYAVGAASTRTFHQQYQVATMQSSLRIALGQLKRDFGRAGFLGTANASGPQSCQPPTAPLHAPAPTGNGALAGIARYDNDFCSNTSNGCGNIAGIFTGPSASVANNRPNGFTGDAVVMMGNYENASEYAGITLLPGSASISVGSTWHGFQSDFMSWEAGTPNAFNNVAFQAVFPIGRLIRIRTTRGQYHFATVTSTTAPNLTVNPPMDAVIAFSPAVPGVCVNDVTNGWVAPINAIRYFPRNEAQPPPSSIETSGPMAQLIRQEVSPTAKQTAFVVGTAAVPARIVLDYLVSFRLRFVLNQAGGAIGVVPDAYSPGWAGGDVNALPEKVRAVYIDLAARTPEQDRSFAWNATSCLNFGCFQVFGNRAGAARVRSAHAEVFIPNIAFEGF